GMENTLFQGERVLVNKWSYGLRLPFMLFFSYHRWGEKRVERGDIVGFNNPANILQPVIAHREIFISRCDGVPGDTLLVDSLFSIVSSANRRNNFNENPLYAYPLHTFIIPQKGKPVKIESWNRFLLKNTVVLHEKKQAEVIGDTLFIEDIPVSEYTFSQDYYWMVSGNSVNWADSRLFGLVPQNHIIGKASLIWFSKEKETGVFKGYRWNRFFKAL
ncbi:Signal peptidase I, partial [termite gut metagenome]